MVFKAVVASFFRGQHTSIKAKMKSQALLQSDNQMKKNKRNCRGCKISGIWIRIKSKGKLRMLRKQRKQDSAAGHPIPARAARANLNNRSKTNKTKYAKTLKRMQTKISQVHKKAFNSVNSSIDLRNHESYKS